MKQSTIAVTNGGLSSISEVLAMRLPMIIIPVKRHLEQKVNANWIQENDLGVISSWDQLKESIEKVIENYNKFKINLNRYNYVNGAQQAVNLIIEEVENEIMR